jgi:hypothetical protein
MTNNSRRSLALALVAAAAGFTPATFAAVTDGLVVHLPFDSNFTDATGRGNNGTPVVQAEIGGAEPGFVTGVIGAGAVQLLTGQHVNLGAPADLAFGADTDFSVAMWIKSPSAGWTSDPAFIGNKSWASGGNLGWVLAAQGNGGWKWNWNSRVDGNGVGRLDTPNIGVIRDDVWHHLVVSHTRTGDAVFYADGVEVSRISIANRGDVDTFDLGLEYNIGNEGTGGYGFANDTGARFSNLSVDDVGIWRRALTSADVAEIYGAGLQGFNLATTASASSFFKNISPAPSSSGAPAIPVIRAEIQAGASAINQASVRMLLNGTVVPATVTQSGATTTVSFAVPSLVPAGSTHTVRVEAKDSANRDVVQEWSFTVGNYATLPAAIARPVNTAGASGLLFRTVWASFVSGTLPDTIARAEAQLAGTLIDPTFGEPYANDALVGPIGGYFGVGVVNFEQSGVAAGNLPGDTAFPGLETGDFNNFATEAIAWLELSPGYYRFGVNSDDGFALTSGFPPRDVLDGIQVGSFDGGRGSADSLLDVVVTEAGLYPFRLIHFEGGGGASLEFFTVDTSTGQRILVNNQTEARAVKAYQTSTGAPVLPYTRLVAPAVGATGVRLDSSISLEIVDGGTAVTTSGIQMTVNGTAVTPTRTRVGNVSTVSFTPTTPYPSDSVVSVAVSYTDGTTTKNQSWTFRTRPAPQPDAITGHWDFNTGDLSATVGYALTYPGAAAQAATQFGTTTSFGIPNIGGQAASVLRFAGASSREIYYRMNHNAAPNGDGSLVNRWTLVMDILFPENGTGTWFSFGQIDNLANGNDGELFVNFAERTGDDIPDGGIGIGGQYTNQEDLETYIQRGQWHRVVFAVDYTDSNELGQAVITKFIDGKKFQDQLRGTGQVDGRHTLRVEYLLFADEDGESQLAFVNSVQIRNYKMTDADIAALGAPGSAGVPINVAVINPPVVVDDVVAAASLSGGQVVLTWTGGSGTFQIRRKSALTDATWTTVGTTTERTFTVPAGPAVGLYQIAY